MDMRREDCYLWIDPEIPEDERTMQVLCTQCHDANFPDLGWFWEGSKLGYGPFDFICCKCGHVVNAAPKSNATNDIGQGTTHENDQTSI